MKILIFILFLIIGLAGEVAADIIYLKNGRSMKGLVEKEKDGNVWLDVGFGTVKFRKEEIERIEHSKSSEARQIRKEWERQKKLEERRWRERDKRIEEARRKEESAPKEIKIAEDIDRIIVSALLNDKVTAKLLLDTGANLIMLASGVAEELGIDTRPTKKDRIEVRIADGRKIEGKYVVLESVDVQGAIARDVGAVVLSGDNGTDAHDGLLGMSFLKRFNFQIDTVEKKLTLKKRE